MPYGCVDGNDIIKMHEISKFAVNHIRNNGEPYLIEAITYRHFGHVDWREDIDVGVNRSQSDVDSWRKRDPISRLVNAMIESNSLTLKVYEELIESIQLNIDKAFESALLGAFSSKNDEYLWTRRSNSD
jgi:pyruvate dehydrogenase E1 component alpha subunit